MGANIMWKYYFLFTVLPNIDVCLTLGFVMCIIFSSLYVLFICLSDDLFFSEKSTATKLERWAEIKKIICFSFLFLLPGIFIPSQKQALLYISGNMILNVNKKIHVSDKAVKYINLYLDKGIKELGGKVTKDDK